MFKNLTQRFVAPAILFTSLLASSVAASAQDYVRTFTLYNRSSLTIRRLFVSPSSFENWGYDRLGSSVLNPNYKVTVELEPGRYDIKLVDQDGDSCVINNVDFRHSDYLVLNNVNLLACELLR
jgi:hypothetical protein